MKLNALLLLLPGLAFAQGMTIKGGATTNLQEVNALKQAYVTTATDGGPIGPGSIADNDGDIAQVDPFGRLSVGLDSLRFRDSVEGVTVDWRKWSTAVTTHAIAQASSLITLNSAASTAVGASQLTSLPYFPSVGGVRVKTRIKATSLPQANAVAEFGFGTASASTAPTDGAFVRWSGAATFQCVYATASSENAVAMTAPTAALFYDIEIIWHASYVTCIVSDPSTGSSTVKNVPVANTALSTASVGRLPVFARLYATNTTSPAPKMDLAKVVVLSSNFGNPPTWTQANMSMGNNATRSPLTAFAILTNVCNFSAAGVPRVRTTIGGACGNIASSTGANTTANYPTLGGWYQLAATATATGDFIAFGYQVPTGMVLHITGVDATCTNYGAATATTATNLSWAWAYGGSAVSLATEVDSPPATMEFARAPIGTFNAPVATAIGADFLPAGGIHLNYPDELIVPPGRFVDLTVRVGSGAATASDVWDCMVIPRGYFEE